MPRLLAGPVWTGAIELGPAGAEQVFDAWVLAAWDTAVAFDAWTRSEAGERGDAHAAYGAALDREERAAAVLEAVVHRRRRW
jgi:heme-degrading monooxygenase HmoA